MTDPNSLAPLRTELIATCELLRFDQLDPIGFVHTDDEFQDACGGYDAHFGMVQVLDDAYDPAGHSRCAIPRTVLGGSTLYQLHRAAHLARTQTFEPFFEWLEHCPRRVLVVLLRHARAQVVRFHLGGVDQLPFPLTGWKVTDLAPEITVQSAPPRLLNTMEPRDVAA